MKSSTSALPRMTTFARTLAGISIVFAILLSILLIISQLLPTGYRLTGVAVLAILSLNTILLTFRKQPRRRAIVLGIISAIFLMLISGIGMKVMTDSRALLQNMTNDDSVVKQDIVTTKPFNVYISGIDTYGDVATVSRSDVNIVATVNPQTKQILLTTIPRDSYVRIAGGGNDQYDKLTHSGIYGITTSTQTVARLLDTDVSSYIRVNFTSLINIVDELGGVDVVNPVSFKTDSGQVFAQGTLHINGKDALTFSRERHNLQGGDNDRGLNQAWVIEAIFQKASSPAILTNYQGVLGVIGSAIETNISEQSLSALINQQIDQRTHWTIETTTVTGKGQTGGLPSYAIPSSQLYMYVVSDDSLKAAQARIRTTLSADR